MNIFAEKLTVFDSRSNPRTGGLDYKSPQKILENFLKFHIFRSIDVLFLKNIFYLTLERPTGL